MGTNESSRSLVAGTPHPVQLDVFLGAVGLLDRFCMAEKDVGNEEAALGRQQCGFSDDRCEYCEVVSLRQALGLIHLETNTIECRGSTGKKKLG